MSEVAGYLTNAGFARFVAKFTMGGGCWEWTGGIQSNGYGRFYRARNGPGPHQQRAHRVAYEEFVGPIPDGLVIDHLCRNRSCVRPAHLEAVTQGENIRRGALPALLKARAAARTHCSNGHEFTHETAMYSSRHGRPQVRECRECGRKRARDYQARRRAALKEMGHGNA